MKTLNYMKNNGELTQFPIHYGRIYKEVPKLINSSYSLIPSLDFFEQRINAWKLNDSKLIKNWTRNSYLSNEGIISNSDGRIKIISDLFSVLKNLNISKPLELNEELVLKKGNYDKFNGVEFSKEELNNLIDRELTKEEALKNELWLAFFQNKKESLESYVDDLYSKFNIPKLMKINLGVRNTKHDTIKGLLIGSLGNGIYTINPSNQALILTKKIVIN